MPELILVAVDIRSIHNVGSLFRTAEGLGVKELRLCGITPYPKMKNDTRLPYVAEKAHQQLHKTALGAETTVAWQRYETCNEAIADLVQEGWRIVALEQDARSADLTAYMAPEKIALVVGTEVTGLTAAVIACCDDVVHIPMKGKKESFNVAIAAGIAMYSILNRR